jgi:hypothetical protein
MTSESVSRTGGDQRKVIPAARVAETEAWTHDCEVDMDKLVQSCLFI